ncbi:MAG: hypothetical protein IMZ70_08390 [Candidatus Atribacteria bacterium]|nr:hypothetical protein [Candidatus Atribacteria bacterium]
MNFKVGQIVKAIDVDGLDIPLNSRARIARKSIYKGMLNIEWLNDVSLNNGDYYTERFVPALEVGEQLEFDFMKV